MLTETACDTRVTFTNELIQAVPAHAIVAVDILAVVTVYLTVVPTVAIFTPADISIRYVFTSAAVLARGTITLVNVDLTVLPLETIRTSTLVVVDKVLTNSSVSAWVAVGNDTFVHFHLTVDASVARHAQAAVLPGLVQARPVVLAWVCVALVDVHLAVSPLEASLALAPVAAARIDTLASVLTRAVFRFFAFVNVQRAIISSPAFVAPTDMTTVYQGCLASGTRVARVAETGVNQVAA